MRIALGVEYALSGIKTIAFFAQCILERPRQLKAVLDMAMMGTCDTNCIQFAWATSVDYSEAV